MPLRQHDRRARGLDGGLLRHDLALAPHRGAQLRQRGFERLDFCGGGTQIRAPFVHDLARHAADLHQFLVALQVDLDSIARGLLVGEIGLRLLDLGELAARLQVGKLLFGLTELPLDLIERRPVVGIILVEQGRPDRDGAAALDI